MKENNEYERQANDFLESTGTTFKATFLKNGLHFHNDKEKRDIYNIELKRGDRVFKFKFGQSLNDSGFKLINSNTNKEIKYTWQKDILLKLNEVDRKDHLKAFKSFVVMKLHSLGVYKIVEPKAPTPYDVLAGIQNYDVGSFKDFCEDFGYSDDSINATKIYKAVLNEYDNVKMLWTDEEIRQLQEVQ